MEQLKEHLSRLNEREIDLGHEGVMASLSKMRDELNKFRINSPDEKEE